MLCDEESFNRVLIHCAAGIHRTGTISYSLLRLNGRSPLEAYAELKVMRKATYEGVGDWRIDLAEKLILPPLLKLTSTEASGKAVKKEDLPCEGEEMKAKQ